MSAEDLRLRLAGRYTLHSGITVFLLLIVFSGFERQQSQNQNTYFTHVLKNADVLQIQFSEQYQLSSDKLEKSQKIILRHTQTPSIYVPI